MHRRLSILLSSTLLPGHDFVRFWPGHRPRSTFGREACINNEWCWIGANASGGGIAGGCDPVVVAHTTSDFGAGPVRGSRADSSSGEIAATSFQLPPDAFPIRLDLASRRCSRPAAPLSSTTTEYAIHAWSGLPRHRNPRVQRRYPMVICFLTSCCLPVPPVFICSFSLIRMIPIRSGFPTTGVMS